MFPNTVANLNAIMIAHFFDLSNTAATHRKGIISNACAMQFAFAVRYKSVFSDCFFDQFNFSLIFKR